MTMCRAGRTGERRVDHIPPPEPDRCTARLGGQGRRQQFRPGSWLPCPTQPSSMSPQPTSPVWRPAVEPVEITWRCHGSGPPAPGWSAPSLCGWLAV